MTKLPGWRVALAAMRPRLRQRRYLVYGMDPPRPPTPALPAPIGVSWLDTEAIESLFDPSPLAERFHEFTAAGYVGLVLTVDGAWGTYAWMSTPLSPPPPHVPDRVAPAGARWIFYCRTRPEHRGKGLYKAAIMLLVGTADRAASRVWIDTEPDNVPARRAVLSVGFGPEGTLNTYRLSVPPSAKLLYGRWRREQIHPPL